MQCGSALSTATPDSSSVPFLALPLSPLADASTLLGPAAKLGSGSRAGQACSSLTGFTADPRLLVRPRNHGKQGVEVPIAHGMTCLSSRLDPEFSRNCLDDSG
ncbi:hypothetical protein M440DRAFT_1063409 [Trichoderma longibrachiatum ATCC 18648]|uniref:Uncharacterized protein n=1 Tax=Trichoderma longibrachiatum ATCC 18648 TaxID=983965 RepID=A0A2T4BVX0_TRILO|nr:hypothetical protein M440DRAFT_1063409 [Trichoderma longibrachiatum ATCC 18648]